jgi:hypothetical protein
MCIGGWPEFAILIEALKDSIAVETLAVYTNKVSTENKLTKQDIGYNNDRLSKLK